MAEDDTSDQKSIAQVLSELWELLVSYAKQETVEPLKGLGRFIAWGVAGSVLASVGVLLLTLAGLRALQTQTDDHLTGNLSWVPYGAALVLLGVLVFGVVRLITKDAKR
ncbi:MAG: hypothetical protein ACR2LQ_05430 [Acidimicrobiales bacterium]